MLVLGVLPLGANAGLEEMVVGLEGKLGNGCDIILKKLARERSEVRVMTHVNAPKFLNGVEGDNFLEEIVPVVALSQVLVSEFGGKSMSFLTLPLGGFVNQRVHLF